MNKQAQTAPKLDLEGSLCTTDCEGRSYTLV